MSYLGFCLFVVWIVFVVGVGVAFLVWAWKQGEFPIVARSGDRDSQNSEPEDVPRPTRIDSNIQAIVADV